MKTFKFDIAAGNTVGRSGKARTVRGMVRIDVNSDESWTNEEGLIHQELLECAQSIRRRLERSFPQPKPTLDPPPSNFLEQHALEALTAEPTWTVNMYAAYNDIDDPLRERLRTFLRHHLPASQTE